MKKIVNLIAASALVLALSGCAEDRTICGTKYQAYGLFNPEKKNPKVDYEVSIGSIVVGAIFIESIIVPIYVFGWDLFEPTHPVGNAPGVVTDNCKS